jgi:DnaK suppressor protein
MLAFQASPTHDAQLSADSLQLLRELLVAESQVQSAQLAAHEAAARQLRDLTDADSVLERDLADAGALRARDALVEIERALERLEAGAFGWCEACGVRVPSERLEAIPSARFCVACLGRAGRP